VTLRKAAHDDVCRFFSQPGLFPRENSFPVSVYSCANVIAQALSPLVVIGTEAKLRIDTGEARSHCTAQMFLLEILLRSSDTKVAGVSHIGRLGCERYDVCPSPNQGNEQWPGLTSRKFVVLVRRRDDDLLSRSCNDYASMMVWPMAV
jgi:hypothetical protein